MVDIKTPQLGVGKNICKSEEFSLAKNTLITVDDKPSIITLKNNTTSIVAFATTPIQANIIIVEVSS